MNTCNIHYDDWQMQCCGTPFSVGEVVKWPIAKWNAVWNAEWDKKFATLSLGTVDHCYDSHSSEYEKLSIIEGTVEKIYVIHGTIEPHPTEPKMNIRYPRKAVSVTYADGKDEDIDGYGFEGYFIILKDYTSRPAKPKDITFS